MEALEMGQIVEVEIRPEHVIDGGLYCPARLAVADSLGLPHSIPAVGYTNVTLLNGNVLYYLSILNPEEFQPMARLFDDGQFSDCRKLLPLTLRLALAKTR